MMFKLKFLMMAFPSKKKLALSNFINSTFAPALVFCSVLWDVSYFNRGTNV